MSQCDRVLDVLADGQPHTMREIHDRAGFMRLNSRISDLRKRGHVITCDPAGGKYVYQLVSLDEPQSVPVASFRMATQEHDPHAEDGRGSSSELTLFDTDRRPAWA